LSRQSTKTHKSAIKTHTLLDCDGHLRAYLNITDGKTADNKGAYNISLFKGIVIEANGRFFTDFWSSDAFDRNNFLKRNRIIAGLSEATIVIESAEKGGSLVTADIANSYNRDVFAVPGRITDSMSIGCNNLIKFQKAHLLSTPMDIPVMLNWKLEEDKQPVIQKQLFVELDTDEKIIYNFLKDNGKELLDVIALKCNMPTFKIAGILLNMELKGVVRPLPGKLFEVV